MRRKILAHLRVANRILFAKLGYRYTIDTGDNVFECLDRNESLIRMIVLYKIRSRWPEVAELERRFLRHSNGRYNRYVDAFDLPF